MAIKFMGYSDDDYASGRVPLLISGEATLNDDGEWSRPSADDYAEAERRARGGGLRG